MFNDNSNEQNFARHKLIISEVSYINKKKPSFHKLLVVTINSQCKSDPKSHSLAGIKT